MLLMAVRAVVVFPDPRLRQPALPVTRFGPDLDALAADIVDTMKAVSALGLTGPHIGVPLRVVVLRLEADAPARTYVNPAITSRSAETASHDEGSVSMPGVRESVERPARIRLAFQDLAGQHRDEEADGFAAATLQHEIDQLDGVFWTARLSRLKRERAEKRFAKLCRIGRAEGI
jgi:peptide deformylase